jgi:hypothetical protein
MASQYSFLTSDCRLMRYVMHAVSNVLSPAASPQHGGVAGEVVFSPKPIGGANSPFNTTSNVGGVLSTTTKLLDHLQEDGEGDTDEIVMPVKPRGGWFKLEPLKHIHLGLSLREHIFLGQVGPCTRLALIAFGMHCQPAHRALVEAGFSSLYSYNSVLLCGVCRSTSLTSSAAILIDMVCRDANFIYDCKCDCAAGTPSIQDCWARSVSPSFVFLKIVFSKVDQGDSVPPISLAPNARSHHLRLVLY